MRTTIIHDGSKVTAKKNKGWKLCYLVIRCEWGQKRAKTSELPLPRLDSMNFKRASDDWRNVKMES